MRRPTDHAGPPFWTEQDEVVTPPNSSRLKGATQLIVQQLCPGLSVSHGDLPRSSTVTAMVLTALAPESAEASYGARLCAAT